jgi:hypothetical protein
LVVDICHSASGLEHRPARAGEIARSVAAIDRAREVLAAHGRQEVSSVSLAHGLRQTLDWVREGE